MSRPGPYLALSPWAAQHLTTEDGTRLHIRAASLEAEVTAIHSRGGWTVRARQGNVTASLYNARGSLAVTIAAVLERFEAERDRVLAEGVARFTPDELVTLADQSA